MKIKSLEASRGYIGKAVSFVDRGARPVRVTGRLADLSLVPAGSTVCHDGSITSWKPYVVATVETPDATHWVNARQLRIVKNPITL